MYIYNYEKFNLKTFTVIKSWSLKKFFNINYGKNNMWAKAAKIEECRVFELKIK